MCTCVRYDTCAFVGVCESVHLRAGTPHYSVFLYFDTFTYCAAAASVSCLCVCYSHKTVLSTRRHAAHPVSALILHPREIQALWSQNYDTGSYVVPGRRQQYNAMPQHISHRDSSSQASYFVAITVQQQPHSKFV